MDPRATASQGSKDGDWDFPEDIVFPVSVKVVVKFFKVAETTSDMEKDKKGPGKKYLDTKIIKVEACLAENDFYSKSNLLHAVEREVGIKELAKEESISNPKIEISVQRKETNEVYHVTKMKHIVNRLQKLVLRQDTFLVEVKEQIFTFAAKSPTIRIHLNNNSEVISEEPGCSGRSLSVKIVSGLNPSLVKLTGSKYERDILSSCWLKV